MKATVDIDIQELGREISKEVIKTIKPLMTENKEKNDFLFTVKSLANYLGVSTQWVYERVHLKEIPYIKIGKFPRFRKSDIDQWLDAQKIPAMNPLTRSLKAVK